MDIQLSLHEVCNFFFESSDVVYSNDAAGIITFVNDRTSEKLGYAREEMIGRHFGEFVCESDLSLALEVHEMAKSNAHPRNFHLRIRHKDGRSMHFDFSAHAMFRDGVFMGGMGIGRDVTARKITEDALGISEKIYKVVVDNARDVIYTVSPEGIVTSVNDYMKSVTGFTAEECIGKQYTYFIHPDDLHYGIAIHEAIMRGEKLPVVEMRFLKKSGDYLHGEFSTTPLFYDGKFLGTLGIGRDVTERKKIEEGIREALEKERELNRLKRHFISMVSHEFRTPLTVINGTAEIAEKDLRSDPPAIESSLKGLARVRDNIKRLSAMLSDIVILSDDRRGEALFVEKIDILDYCRETIDDAVCASQGGTAVTLAHDDSVGRDPLCDIDCTIMCHVLTNLVGNAIKYSPGGEAAELFVGREAGRLVFRVTDRGIGIPADCMKELFRNFMRGTNVGKIPGTGMGLAIVKKCVDAHGGDILVESRENCGTTVTVKIPVLQN